jgi:hypothetical protein
MALREEGHAIRAVNAEVYGKRKTKPVLKLISFEAGMATVPRSRALLMVVSEP